jgi:hypothetical protein
VGLLRGRARAGLLAAEGLHLDVEAFRERI